MDWSQRHFRRFVFWVALKSRIQSRDNGIEAVRKYWGLVSFIDVPKNSNVADIFSAKRTCLYVICPLFALCMDLKVDWSFPCQSMGDFPSAAMWCVMSLWPLGGHCGSWPGTFFTESFSRLQLWSPKKKKVCIAVRTNGESGHFGTNEWRNRYGCGSDLPGWKSPQHRVSREGYNKYLEEIWLPLFSPWKIWNLEKSLHLSASFPLSISPKAHYSRVCPSWHTSLAQ